MKAGLLQCGRDSMSGASVLLAMLCSLLAIIDLAFAALSALLYWGAAIAMLSNIGKRNLHQCLLLLTLGLMGIGYGIWMRADFDVLTMLSGNVAIVSMLVAVSFLTALSRPNINRQERLPRGPAAVIATYSGVHLFGAVINISALMIYAQRLAANRPISRSQLVVLSRGFTAAALWSPFFAAMAVAVSYAPQANVLMLIGFGLGLTALGLLYTCLEQRKSEADRTFYGFPLRPSSLWLPLLLTVLVFVFHELFAQLSILFIITACSPVLFTVSSLLAGRLKRQSAEHIVTRLPKMGNEIVLFLSAGVFSYGLKLALSTHSGWQLFAQFNAATASLCFAGIVLLAMCGFHMVIGISIIAPLVLPLNPDPTMLAFVFLTAWSLGSAASPLSGVNISLQSSYDVSGNTLLSWHKYYVLFMSLGVVSGLFLLERILGE